MESGSVCISIPVFSYMLISMNFLSSTVSTYKNLKGRLFGHRYTFVLLFQLLLKTSNIFQLSMTSEILEAASLEFKAD